MKEYTLLAFSSALITCYADAASGVKLLSRKEFYIFSLVILFFKFLVNGYLTHSKIIIYNPDFILGLRIGSIPFEDFLFGFSLVTQTIIFWELLKRK